MERDRDEDEKINIASDTIRVLGFIVFSPVTEICRSPKRVSSLCR